jgi:two-component system chemotaxis response regulator CheB
LEVEEDLVRKVLAAATARISPPPGAPVRTLPAIGHRASQAGILVIGVSTGGPQALRQLIPQLPPDFPIPVAVVIHMPAGFTELFARHLDEVSPLNVVEAGHDQNIGPGMVLIAPAGYHLSFVRHADGSVKTCLGHRPRDTPHRPAVDVLFRSAAEVFAERVLAIVLTGMGADGTAGAAWIKAQGGRVYCEAEESCVVYGMPRSVVEAGLSDAILPLADMAQGILKAL